MAQGREFPIIGHYNKQRFTQWGPEDCANWYRIEIPGTKKQSAMYPAMGRAHISLLGVNKLIFPVEPRALYRSNNYGYVVSADKIYRIDNEFNQIIISNASFTQTTGDVWFAVLYTPANTYACFTDGIQLYVHTEETLGFDVVTDPNLTGNIPNPLFIAAFGNRIVVSQANGSNFSLSAINLGSATSFNPATCFTNPSPTPAVFAQADAPIMQMGVNQNLLYIFTEFTTEIWANITSTISNTAGINTGFPWKKNTSYGFNYGIADPHSLDIAFGFMVWLGSTKRGLLQVVASSGQTPVPISDKAIDVLFQNSASQAQGSLSPFVEFDAFGFLYQYENTIFYRLSAGQYQDIGILDYEGQANSIEYNFDTREWNRVIEVNGNRNRCQHHIFYSNRHLVSVQDDNTVYELAGNIYINEVRSGNVPDASLPGAYIQQPMRYIKITPIIFEPDYSEFMTEWAQIDFVWGNSASFTPDAVFNSATFVIGEDDSNGPQYITDQNGNFIITENSNSPTLDSNFYFNLFKPSIEFYFSDDSGSTWNTADNLQFSDLGQYSWRMRWYQLGASRARVYKLICVSPYPIVVLGGWMLTRRISGGAA